MYFLEKSSLCLVRSRAESLDFKFYGKAKMYVSAII